MANNSHEHHQIVSFAKQISILLWKNFKLTIRNRVGIIVEIFCPLIFLAVLFILRNYVDKINYDDQKYVLNNTFNLLPLFFRRTRILYYPNNDITRKIVNNAVNLIEFQRPDFFARVIGSDTNDCSKLDSATIIRLIAFISFPQNMTNNIPDNVEYSICTQEDPVYQYNIDSLFPNKTDYMYNRSPEDFCTDTTYFDLYDTFNVIKTAIDMSIIDYQTNTSLYDPDMLKVQRFSCPKYRQDDLLSTFSFLLPIVISLTYLFTSIITIGNIINDKESKMKEYLKLVGVKWYSIWISWFIRSIILFIPISFLLSGITLIYLPPQITNNFTIYSPKAMFEQTNYGITLLMLLTYSFQITLFILLLSQFFQKAFLAKVIVILIWIMTSLDFYDEIESRFKYILCFLPNVGLLFSLKIIFQYERSGKIFEIQSFYSNLFNDPLNIGALLATMFAYSLAYIPLTWYFERILPGDFGIPLPFYFPFMPSYWCKEIGNRKFNEKQDSSKEIKNENFEAEPVNLEKTVCLNNIYKTFRNDCRTKQVLENLSLKCYKNQITTLLGSNGAGKSTTMFILCGLNPPSDGTATILNYDLLTEIDKIRSSIGFCPQQSILYDNLTVGEHLELIAMVKSYRGKHLKDEVDRISQVVDLYKDLTTLSKNLSGGMKRRLSVAMSLVGDSQIIIMDEPSSSLDPFNRRALWDTIKNYKDNRTIILTTHFMEEADALSDRIAIIDNGQIQAYGSPLFLKNHYGEGYRLTMSKSSTFNESKFTQLLKSQIFNYKIETNIATEISIGIPKECFHSLPNLLANIETQMSTIGINSYGISTSTIEEVFLRLKKLSETNAVNSDILISENDSHCLLEAFSEEIKPLKYFKLWFQQFKYLLYKRINLFFRRYILAFMIVCVPIIIEGIAAYLIPSQSYLIDRIGNTVQKYGKLKLDINNYGRQIVPYSVYGDGDTESVSRLLKDYISITTTSNITFKRVDNISLDNPVDDYVFNLRKSDINNIVDKYYLGFAINVSKTNNIQLSSYYSTLAYHSSATILSFLHNFLFEYTNQNKSSPKSITTYNTPLPANSTRYNGNRFLKYLACFDILPLSLLNLFTSINVGFFISLLVMHTAKERINGFKCLQLLSGTPKLIYWFTNYIFDFILCAINVGLLISVLKLVDYFKNDSTSELNAISMYPTVGYVALILFVSAFTWPILAHLWSFLFKSDVTSFVILAIVLGIIPFIDVVFAFVLLFINTGPDYADVRAPGSDALDVLRMIITIIFPNLTVKKAIYNLKIRNSTYCINSINTILKTKYNTTQPEMNFQEPGIGMLLMFSAIQLVIGIFILICLETKFFHIINIFKRIKCRSHCVEDSFMVDKIEDDVKAEHDRIKNSNVNELSKTEPLIVNDLYKTFKKRRKSFKAVNSLSFGIGPYQCFGLLGLNGAGKSTTFKILTGELEPTSGTAFINGFDISKQRWMAQKNLGFCPQNDYLPDYMTVNECLKLFARLKGLTAQDSSRSIQNIMSLFKLKEHQNKLVKNLSGGNKRKVSVAIAFLGKPNVIFLDEPSNGWDPISKRYLWSVINKAKQLGLCIILTSHRVYSMEECEALCTKLAIMVNGQFQCLGSIQYLKSRYGKGYSLIIKCDQSDEDDKNVKKVIEFMKENVKSSILKDQQQETLFYQIEYDESEENNNEIKISIANLFTLIEQNKINLGIQTYSISQTTLEQVFLSFASKQVTDKKEDHNNKHKQVYGEFFNLKMHDKTNNWNAINGSNSTVVFSSLDSLDPTNNSNYYKKTESKKLRIFKAKLNINI